mgnify:CR=1 FL=1
MSQFRVGYLVGSLAKASINRKLARSAGAPGTFRTRIAGDSLRGPAALQLVTTMPTSRRSRKFKEAIAAVDAVLFVTPELLIARFPAVSRTRSTGEPAVSQELVCPKPLGRDRRVPGKIGTAIAQQHLRSILCFCNSPLMNTVEAYIQFTPGLITDTGEVTDDTIGEFLSNYLNEFHGFISRVYTVLPRTA